MTKIALITGSSRGLGKSTALHLARQGVDVIVTYHSNETEANSVVAAIEDLDAKAIALKLDSSNTKTFLGRVGLPDDIGGAIASLLSEENKWVNAQRIEISGGQSI